MSRVAFKTIKFHQETLDLIQKCNEIIEEYQQQDLRLTLRQLYYQLVSRDIVENTVRSYKNVGSAVADGRLAGLIDWDAIEDRGRQPRSPPEWSSVDEIVRGAVNAFRLPRWRGQEMYVELWVEKEALAGVLEPIASDHHVTLMVNKGYSSASAMYESAQRIRAEADGRPAIVFYLGDHDPSGEDMVRDVGDRLFLFGADVDVKKLALTMPQVDQYRPPPNPAKVTDSRARAYIEKHGPRSWEVDALPPNVLARVIRDAFRKVIDREAMNEVVAEEEQQRKRIRSVLHEEQR